MKRLILALVTTLALPSIGLAGGNSSIVDIDEVTEIQIEEGKITIKGSAVIRRRVISTAEKGDTTVFGRPAQWLYAKVDDAVFEVVPYDTPGIEGVPGGGEANEEMRRTIAKWWAGTKETAQEIKKGDAVEIGYQGDITTINGVRVTKIIGYGSLRKKV